MGRKFKIGDRVVVLGHCFVLYFDETPMEDIIGCTGTVIGYYCQTYRITLDKNGKSGTMLTKDLKKIEAKQ